MNMVRTWSHFQFWSWLTGHNRDHWKPWSFPITILLLHMSWDFLWDNHGRPNPNLFTSHAAVAQDKRRLYLIQSIIDLNTTFGRDSRPVGPRTVISLEGGWVKQEGKLCWWAVASTELHWRVDLLCYTQADPGRNFLPPIYKTASQMHC